MTTTTVIMFAPDLSVDLLFIENRRIVAAYFGLEACYWMTRGARQSRCAADHAAAAAREAYRAAREAVGGVK